jgi:hypothetical protein
MAIRAAAAKLFCDLDYVISPVSPVVNFAAELASPDQRSRKSRSSTSATPCRGTWRKTRPSRSTAAYDERGFPIGVQIVGRRFDDLGVLGMAKAFEGLRGPQKPWPSRRRSRRCAVASDVMRGLDPRIHLLHRGWVAGVKPGNDELESRNKREGNPMAYETIKYEVAEQILTITLNRPDKLNAFNGTMQKEMIEAFDAADKDDNIRAIIVTGAGRAFCAGADLSSGADTFDRDARRGPVKDWPMARSITAIRMCATAADRSRCASSNA